MEKTMKELWASRTGSKIDSINQCITSAFHTMDNVLSDKTLRINQQQRELGDGFRKLKEDQAASEAEKAQLKYDREMLNKEKADFKLKVMEELEEEKAKLRLHEKQLSKREGDVNVLAQKLEGQKTKMVQRERACLAREQSIAEKEEEIKATEERLDSLNDLHKTVQQDMQKLKERKIRVDTKDKEVTEKLDQINAREENLAQREVEVSLEKQRVRDLVEEYELMGMARDSTPQTELSRQVEPGVWYDIKEFCSTASNVGTELEKRSGERLQKVSAILAKCKNSEKQVIKFENGVEATVGVRIAGQEVSTLQSAYGKDLSTSMKNIGKELVDLVRGSMDESRSVASNQA